MLSVALFSSDDDDEYNAVEVNALRRQLRLKSNIFAMSNSTFVSNFRLNKAAFKYTLEKVTPQLEEPTRSTHVPNALKLAATMRILAGISYQKGAGNDYIVSLSQSSVSKAFQQCLDIMYTELCPIWISFPMDENEKCEIKEYFSNETGFPGVIGCIDSTHIKIMAPGRDVRSKYLNGKGFHCLNATVVCDHQLRIRYISPHHQGSEHDASVWNNSKLKQYLRANYDNGERNTWLLGDADYPLQKYLITPFRSPEEGSPESSFNSIHESARSMVERTICVLKHRFRCLLGTKPLHYTPEMAGKITAVCAALHNICVHFKADSPEINTVPEIEESTNFDDDDDLNALTIRSTIMKSLNI